MPLLQSFVIFLWNGECNLLYVQWQILLETVCPVCVLVWPLHWLPIMVFNSKLRKFSLKLFAFLNKQGILCRTVFFMDQPMMDLWPGKCSFLTDHFYPFFLHLLSVPLAPPAATLLGHALLKCCQLISSIYADSKVVLFSFVLIAISYAPFLVSSYFPRHINFLTSSSPWSTSQCFLNILCFYYVFSLSIHLNSNFGLLIPYIMISSFFLYLLPLHCLFL